MRKTAAVMKTSRRARVTKGAEESVPNLRLLHSHPPPELRVCGERERERVLDFAMTQVTSSMRQEYILRSSTCRGHYPLLLLRNSPV
jgi:hypothetical protein